eukprot:3098924-Rhodomonas_salina.1
MMTSMMTGDAADTDAHEREAATHEKGNADTRAGVGHETTAAAGCERTDTAVRAGTAAAVGNAA